MDATCMNDACINPDPHLTNDCVIGDPNYSALLQEDEDRADLDCGCVLERDPNGGLVGEVAVTFCRMHDASRDLLDAARKALALIDAHMEQEDGEDRLNAEEEGHPWTPIDYLGRTELRAAINKATGEEG